MLKNRIGLTRCRLDKLSTPDDAKDQFEKQAYTRRLPFASRKSTQTQGSTTLASTLGPTLLPPLLPPKVLVPSFCVVSNPIFCVKDIAYTELIVHVHKYLHETVNGLSLFLGRHSSDGSIDIVNGATRCPSGIAGLISVL